MVGAGLSRQTEPDHPSEKRPPSWQQLAGLLQETLRCGRPDSEHGSTTESVTARDCSRLAQQYKATFGQSALDSFLLEHVPDGEPDSVHERLLSLPWADVFTTNWDTLLEKAGRGVFERTYEPVLCSADLATTVAPRIVKLHGSFPSFRPFVVTEEDYRTYPTRFAPLVNTVQQALMESIFLLIGFSGDDPNFLHWCGWVRDHLGPAAPRLYLAGALGLDRPTRLMLEERGVIPIDLASEVSGAPSIEAGHRRATEWILDSLEAGETREQRWPFPPPHPPGAGTSGITLPVPPSGQPREAPAAPSQGPDSEALAAQSQNVAAIWRHNRRVYPGWPVLPFSKHSRLSAWTESWVEPMLKVAPSLDPLDRLAVVRELLERTELLLDPLTPDLVEAATEALDAVEEYLALDRDLSHEQRNEIEEDRTELMLSLLTDARHDLDQRSFDDWAGRLERIVRPGTSAFHRLQHERCLWRLRVQDFEGLDELLKAWRIDDADPMWSLRKAAVMVESGDVNDAHDLVLPSLQRAERAWSRDRRVLTAARLGWALHWRHALDWARWWDEPWQGNSSLQPDADLWSRLARYEGHARSDLNAYVRQMTTEQGEDSPWTFDLGRVNRITLFHPEPRAYRSAWRVIRLLELSGLPSGIPRVRIASDHIERAARLVAPFNSAYAARLLLLGGAGNKETLDAVVSQVHLARMSDQEASSLFEAAQRARDHFLGRWAAGGKAGDFYQQRVERAVEIMSRCVARHGADLAAETFSWAMRYSRPRRWVDNRFWSSVARLWKRSWNAMDLGSRASAVSEILRTPIPEDALLTDSDPGELLFDEHLRINRADVDEPIWASCVHQICGALGGNEYARRLAFDRLNPIARKHLLSETEELEVALSLWGTVHQESDGLPHIGQVDDWLYLVLPEPERGIAERRFRAKWIGRDVTDATSETGVETIRNVAGAWNPDYVEKRAIRLTDDEQAWFWRFVEAWLRHEAGQSLMRVASSDPAIDSLVDVLTHRPAPPSVLHLLAENAARVSERRTPIVEQWSNPEQEYLMMVAAAALGGGDSGEAEHLLRLGTRSPDGRKSLAAWKALEWWIVRSGPDGEVSLNPPSVESVQDIGIAIATSQKSGLLGALRAACAIYRSRNPEFIEAVHPQVIQGLHQLRSELDYRASVTDRQIAEELPLHRHWCVWLALSMKDADRGDDEMVRAWIEAGDSDPLAIVRFVREWHAARDVGRDA